jgi:hypothetical protein
VARAAAAVVVLQAVAVARKAAAKSGVSLMSTDPRDELLIELHPDRVRYLPVPYRAGASAARALLNASLSVDRFVHSLGRFLLVAMLVFLALLMVWAAIGGAIMLFLEPSMSTFDRLLGAAALAAIVWLVGSAFRGMAGVLRGRRQGPSVIFEHHHYDHRREP